MLRIFATKPDHPMADLKEARKILEEIPAGDPQRALTWDELAAKFREGASGTLSATATEKAIATIGALDELPDVRQLTALLAGA